jgi:two-component system chemotaxis response regulator CheB
VTREIDLIVIGGSAGAIDVLHRMLDPLGARLRPATAVVIHVPAEGPDLLTEIFSSRLAAPVKVAEDKEPIAAGTIYFAAPDYHLLVEKNHTFALSHDERVHYSRPAIDVLFESAAEAFGPRLMGVILSGANEDGAAGLRAIAEAGGVTVVQSVESAEMIAMPAAALQAAPASIEVDVAGLAAMLQEHIESKRVQDRG